MDGSLSGNHRFRLNESAASNNDGKLFVFVKLTDSCMKTIETYLKQNKKSNLSNKSNIKFNPNGGEISIPNNNNGDKKIYSFQISPENKTPEVFQCIKQINKDQLESCGLIEQKLNIHAQEDVYSMTKTKVTEYQKIEDSTKKQTKEIGESSKTILQKKTNKNSNNRLSTSANNSKQRTTTTTTTTAAVAAATNQDSHLSPTGNVQNLASERPLRERLVHLLAAKRYKKPELLVRLKLDGGIRDDEKEQLDSLLSVISTQSKAGEFIILKTILTSGEVNYDWPFYPKAEASSVRKQIKELQANVNRSTINNSSRLSTASINTNNNNKSSTTKSNNLINRLTTDDENTLNDQRMQQLSNMLDKLTNTTSQCEKSDEELINEDDLDEAEKEYNRIVPEYNQLIDYLKTVSDKYSLFEQQFNEEQTNDKAKKIVDEFFQNENEEFIEKRQRVVQLHFKLKHLQKILQINSPSNRLEFSEDEN